MVNYTKKKYLNLFLKLSFVFLCIFCFTKNVNAKTLFADSIPYQVEVLTGTTTTSPQASVSSQTLLGNQYYGFTYGTQNYSYGLKFNYNAISAMNDKEIISAHFSMYTTALYAQSDFPLSIFIKDNYNNIITCDTNGWSTKINDGVGGSSTGTELRQVLTASCRNGHLSGPFSVIVNNRFYHYVGYVGISEVSFMYSDGTDDSTILNDLKTNTKETNDLLKDSSVDTNGVGNIQNNQNIPSTSGIQDLITMPIKFLTSLSSSINGTCNAISLPYIKNTTIVLPCYDLGSKLGILWTLIDLFGVFILIKTFGKTLKRIFVDFTSLNLSKGDLIE